MNKDNLSDFITINHVTNDNPDKNSVPVERVNNETANDTVNDIDNEIALADEMSEEFKRNLFLEIEAFQMKEDDASVQTIDAILDEFDSWLIFKIDEFETLKNGLDESDIYERLDLNKAVQNLKIERAELSRIFIQDGALTYQRVIDDNLPTQE